MGWFGFELIFGLVLFIFIDLFVNDKLILFFIFYLFVWIVLIVYIYFCIFSEVFKEKVFWCVSSKK